MRAKVVFLRSAEHDLKELKAYLTRHFGPAVWQASYTQIKEAVRTLESFPQGGSVPEELRKLHLTQYRQIISGKNRIIYEIRQDTLYIHIICDTRKNLLSVLAERLVRSD